MPRSLPTHQCLGCVYDPDAVPRQGCLRLVTDHELSRFDRLSQLGFRHRPVPLHARPKHCLQVRHHHRLLQGAQHSQAAVGAQASCGGQNSRVHPADEQYLGARRFLGQGPQQLDAVRMGHHKVKNDHGGRKGAVRGPELFGRICRHHIEAEVFRNVADECVDLRLVIYDQQLVRIRIHCAHPSSALRTQRANSSF